MKWRTEPLYDGGVEGRRTSRWQSQQVQTALPGNKLVLWRPAWGLGWLRWNWERASRKWWVWRSWHGSACVSSFRPVVPNLFGTRNRFRGRQIFGSGSGEWFPDDPGALPLLCTLECCRWSDKRYSSVAWRLGSPAWAMVRSEFKWGVKLLRTEQVQQVIWFTF